MTIKTNGAYNSSAIHFDKKVITYAVKNTIIFNDIILLLIKAALVVIVSGVIELV